ncbi:Calcium-transporting ATPase 12, plasma membrane-type, partial [Mucuna pruriens]
MSQPQASTSSAGGVELGATATIILTTTSKKNYSRIWRRSLYIRFFISVKKPTTSSGNHDSPLYTSLPPSRTSSSDSYVAISVGDVEECIISDIAQIVKDQDLESLQKLGGVDYVCAVLGGQRQPLESKKGIIDDGIFLSGFFLESCKCYRCTILMLLISAGLSFAIEFKQEGPKHGWHDGVAIVFAVFLLVAGNSIANFWRKRKMLKLAKRKEELEFRVKRGEQSLMVPISGIVVGDIVCLWPGEEVPADGLLVSDGILVLAEPDAIKRKHDSKGNPFLKPGSKVIGGLGRMVVASVGNKMNSAEVSTCSSERRGLLESLIEKPISHIDIAALFISVLVALVVFIRLICGKDGSNSELPEMKGKISISLLMEEVERVFLRPQGRVSILTGFVTVSILCVQHGMPLVITISLKYQIDSKLDVVVNDLSACTTMGLVTDICIDASGGLISKPMEVSRIWMGEKDISKVEGSETDQPVLDMLIQGVGLSVLAPEISLSPLSKSLVSWAEVTRKMNLRSFLEENFNILKHSKLNSDKEGSGVLVRKVGDNEQGLHLHWSGAASSILNMCSEYHDTKGNCHAMENQKIKFEQVIEEMEKDDLKPIAFAYRRANGEELEQEELILLGLIGLKCGPSQESIKSTLKNLINAANVQIKLVSEDDITVVKGIACELELEHGIVLEGKEFQDLNKEARPDKVDQAHVMGSFHPEDKLRMIKCLQEKGKVVAFIGTRLMTSYTSVLKVADVGIGHDSLNTIMDRDSYDLTIKCFSALESIVMTGRSRYHNIQKFIQLHLTFTISGLVITLITTTCTGDSPLAAFQLIWVNVLMCILGGLMMVMNLTSKEQLAKQPSNHRNHHMITKQIWKDIVIQVLYQASVTMILEFGGHVTNREKKVRETMIFNIFLLCQLFNLPMLNKEVLKGVVQSLRFLGVLGCCFLMQVLVIEYAKGLADCMQLNATRWGICVLIGALPWVLEWTLKKIPPVILNPSTNYASEAITSHSFNLFPAFPFLMLFVFPVGLIFSQTGTSMTFR